MPELTIFVCTYNSAATLEECLVSIVASEPGANLVVIDHASSDGTVEIAKRFGAEIRQESVGLGYARQLCFEISETTYLAFVDGDEEIVEKAFFRKAMRTLRNPEVGAVAGLGLGHRFTYGLPMGVLVLRSGDFRGKVIPPYVNAREEIFVRRRLNALGLATVFLADAKVHRSQYRRYKAEWEGANTRLAAGVSPPQLLFILKVMLLQSLNGKRLGNVLYVPIFYLRFLRGFVDPAPWRVLKQVNS